jgi:PDZ domain-containing protein
MSRRGLTFLAAGVFAAVLIALGYVLPVPYVVLVPGPVTDTLGTVAQNSSTQVVSVSGATTYPVNGHIFLTTVGVVPGSCSAHPTLFQALRAWWDKSEAVEPHQAICPPGETSQAVQQQNEQDMTDSQRDAVTAALLQLGYKPSSEQIIVADVDPGAPAAQVLQAGDVVVAVDGTKLRSAAQLHALISAHAIGTTVRVTVRRGKATHTYAIRTVASTVGKKHAIVGITPDINATFKKPSVQIGIDPAQVGGPSAGLAFTLGILDKLTPGGLTGGRTIASTGTIDGFGIVGPIGGIQQKIAGAERAGATVFLAPAADCADAKSVASKSLILVKVETLKTALSALRAIDSGSTAYPRC